MNQATTLPEQAQGALAKKNLRAYHTESLDSGLSDSNLVARLWPFLRPHRSLLYAAIVTSLLTSGLALARPVIMLYAIDRSLAAHDPALLLRGGVLFAIAAVLEQVLGFVQIYATQVVGARAMADLRVEIFRFLCRLPQRFFDQQPVGRLVTRVTGDVDSIQELFNSGIVGVVGSLVRVLGAAVLMLTLEIELSLIAFTTLPLIAVVTIWVRRRARESFRAIRGETARMNADMNEQVTGLAVVQAYGREQAMFEQFDGINLAYRDANMRSIKYEAIQDAAIDAVGSISLALIVVALGYHHATFGTVVALSAYLTMFFEPISTMAQLYTLIQSALSGAERVFGLLSEPARDAPEVIAPVSKDRGSEYALEFDRVTFGYKAEPVLHEISLYARPGEMVALVGPTGSGKTTLTALLLRLYETWSGQIFLGGRDITSFPVDALRSKFAVVPQDVVLFPGTLLENVALGQEPDRARVRQVLEQMGVLDLFERREEGLDTLVRGGGANFSAGERQLIAFARALYREAELLILDEATASVDSATEARLQQALGALVRGRTSIVVAHRLSTIRSADKIIVLQKGRVVESGTHEQLMIQKGLYAALYELQLARGD